MSLSANKKSYAGTPASILSNRASEASFDGDSHINGGAYVPQPQNFKFKSRMPKFKNSDLTKTARQSSFSSARDTRNA